MAAWSLLPLERANILGTARCVAAIAALSLAVGCAPLITPHPPEPLAEGSAKTANASILTRFCQWRAPSSVRFRASTATTWTNAPSPTMTSGEIAFLRRSWWETPIPGSESFPQGSSYVVEWTIPYWGRPWFNCPSRSAPRKVTRRRTFTVTPAFRLTTLPASVVLPAGNSSTFDVQVQRFGTFAAPVTVTAGGLPPGVIVTPVSASVTGASATFTLSTSTEVAAGAYSATLSGTSPPRTAQQSTLAITVTRPTVSSVSPTKAPRGATVTVSGTDFDPNCVNNYVTLASINVVPSSCTASSVNVLVPNVAPYGPTQVSVTTNSVVSNSVAFSVARESGAFVEITQDVQGRISSPRTCSTGEVRLNVTGSYVASYRRSANNALIGNSIGFQHDSRTMTAYSGATPVKVRGVGGAGFSLCSTGIVLDADAIDTSDHVFAYRFLRFDDGGLFSKAFDYFTAITVDAGGTRRYGSIIPELYRSPDGTIFIAVVASDTGVRKKALIIDRQNGNTLATVEFQDQHWGSLSATLTSTNTVVITYTGITYPGVSIP